MVEGSAKRETTSKRKDRECIARGLPSLTLCCGDDLVVPAADWPSETPTLCGGSGVRNE